MDRRTQRGRDALRMAGDLAAADLLATADHVTHVLAYAAVSTIWRSVSGKVAA